MSAPKQIDCVRVRAAASGCGGSAVSAPEPLSAERRAEIEAWFLAPGHSGCDVHDEIDDVCDQCAVGILLAEIDRQAAEVDRLRAITERGAATIEAARRLVDVHEQRGGINGVLAARKNLSAALAALADPVRLPEPEPDGAEYERWVDGEISWAEFSARLPEKGEPADG
jgi:hypothetical protein